MDRKGIKCPKIPTVIINNPAGNYTPVSFSIAVKESNPKEYYSPESNDDVYFTLSTSYSSKNPVLQKKLSDKTLSFDEDSHKFNFEFSYEDTIGLEYGEYVGDISIIKPDQKPQLICYVEFNNCFASSSRSIEVV